MEPSGVSYAEAVLINLVGVVPNRSGLRAYWTYVTACASSSHEPGLGVRNYRRVGATDMGVLWNGRWPHLRGPWGAHRPNLNSLPCGMPPPLTEPALDWKPSHPMTLTSPKRPPSNRLLPNGPGSALTMGCTMRIHSHGANLNRFLISHPLQSQLRQAGPAFFPQVLEVAYLDVAVVVASGSDLAALAQHMASMVSYRRADGEVEHLPLQSALKLWRVGQSNRFSPAILEVPGQQAWGTLAREHLVLRSVCVTQRTDRARLLFPTLPSKGVLRVWLGRLAGDVGQQPAPQIRQARIPRTASLATDPELVLDWLEATSHLKDVRKARQATSSWARIFSRATVANRFALEADVEHVDYTVLRRARVRLDICAMLLFRMLFHCMFQQDAENVQLYLYCDSSPQWRGLELFSSSVDLYDGKTFTRRLMPCIALGRSMMNARGKALALCWQCVLLSGLTIDLARFFWAVFAECSLIWSLSGLL